ncbi:MAG: hypothetical protein NWF06_07035 [Candidatus Bathyarchaeota archaeon]|nr:hypothetical protein [Candidatus Bathyarchaeum sp.]
MAKKGFLILICFLVLWIAVTVLALTWGNRFDWPDNVHVDYGFPLVWATQTLSTIVGAVDLWVVDLSALAVNAVCWLGIMVVVVSVMLYFFDKEK